MAGSAQRIDKITFLRAVPYIDPRQCEHIEVSPPSATVLHASDPTPKSASHTSRDASGRKRPQSVSRPSAVPIFTKTSILGRVGLAETPRTEAINTRRALVLRSRVTRKRINGTTERQIEEKGLMNYPRKYKETSGIYQRFKLAAPDPRGFPAHALSHVHQAAESRVERPASKNSKGLSPEWKKKEKTIQISCKSHKGKKAHVSH